MQMDLTSRTAIVTGGGTGIGRAISIGFSRCGAKVVVNYRCSKDEAEQTVKDIEQLGGYALAVRADVTSSDDVQAMVDKTIAAFGGVDILVNNAGGTFQKATVDQLPEDIWDKTIALNLKSIYLCCKAVIPHLPDHTGRVINITSISGHTGGGKGGLAYGAAKGGAITLTRGLAHELAPRGITANAIAPGIIDTRLHQLGTPPEVYRALIERVPLHRDGQPDELVGIAVLLACDQGAYITGQIIHVNGGMIMV